MRRKGEPISKMATDANPFIAYWCLISLTTTVLEAIIILILATTLT